jgi:hypothetical protein
VRSGSTALTSLVAGSGLLTQIGMAAQRSKST